MACLARIVLNGGVQRDTSAVKVLENTSSQGDVGMELR